MNDRAAEKDALAEAVRALHTSSQETRGVGRYTPDNDKRWTPYCEEDGDDWPCETVLLLPNRFHASIRDSS